MVKEKQRSVYATIILIFLLMIFNAVVDNARGIFIPLFKVDFSINDAQIGYMLTASSAAYMLFTFLGGVFCEKLGQKKVFLSGLFACTASLLLLSNAYNYIFLVTAMFILNIGLALISIAANTLVPVLLLSYQAVLMNITHFCYGLGSAVGQRAEGILVYRGVNWRTIYLACAILFVLLFVLFLIVDIPRTVPKKAQGSGEKFRIVKFLKNKIVLFYLFTLGFYVFAEAGTVNWFVNFIKKNYLYNEDRSSFYLSLFFVMFTLGRFLGGFIVEKLGYLRTVLYFLILSAILFTAGIIAGEKGLFIISSAGFFFSITFPTVVLSISRVFKSEAPYVSGIILTCSSFTSMLLNLFMGLLNISIGTYKAFFLIPVSLLISIVFLLLLIKNTKQYFVR